MNDPTEPLPTPLTAETPSHLDLPAAEAAAGAPDEVNSGEVSSAETTADTSHSPASTKKRVAPQAIVAQFIAAWPLAFFNDPRAVKPLAIGILKHMLANRPAELDGLNSHAIRAGIKFYTSRLSYHYGVRHNAHRIDLAGEPAEAIDDAARAHAEAQIAAITAARAAKRPAPVANGTETTDDEAQTSAPPARRPRRTRAQHPARPPSAEGSADRAQNTNPPDGSASTAKAHRKPRPERERGERSAERTARSSTKHPVARPEPTVAPDDGLTMAEKLARLAQHFGKPG